MENEILTHIELEKWYKRVLIIGINAFNGYDIKQVYQLLDYANDISSKHELYTKCVLKTGKPGFMENAPFGFDKKKIKYYLNQEKESIESQSKLLDEKFKECREYLLNFPNPKQGEILVTLGDRTNEDNLIVLKSIFKYLKIKGEMSQFSDNKETIYDFMDDEDIIEMGNQSESEKIKTTLSAKNLAMFFKILYDAGIIDGNKMNAKKLIELASKYFSSKEKENLALNNFDKNYYSTDNYTSSELKMFKLIIDKINATISDLDKRNN